MLKVHLIFYCCILLFLADDDETRVKNWMLYLFYQSRYLTIVSTNFNANKSRVILFTRTILIIEVEIQMV